MKSSRIFIFVIAFFSLIFLTGCIGVNRQFGEIKDKIMGEFGTDIEPSFNFQLGRQQLLSQVGLLIWLQMKNTLMK